MVCFVKTVDYHNCSLFFSGVLIPNSGYKYSVSTRNPQLTPYEIRVGSIIPAVMVSGINSDLPGDIIAQVSQDIRDTKTGRFVLIPQGSKLIGRYDSHVAMGQERVMIAWYRLQFPDASTFDLDNMGAVDLAGYSGMHDQVNNPTWRLFKNAFLLSVIGAGAQMLSVKVIAITKAALLTRQKAKWDGSLAS